MDIKQSTDTGNATSVISKGQELLDKALSQEPIKPNCRHSYGKHEWTKHEETHVEYCRVCSIRRDTWEGQPSGNQQATEIPDNNGNKKGTEEYKVGYKNPPLETQIKPGEVRNPHGRPKGSRNLTNIVLDALRAKEITVKLPDGSTATISGEEAFAEAVLENAIKKKDRESLRMIWEFSDGKPTQQHKIEVNGPKGYQVDAEREKIYQEQFDRVLDIVPETSQIAPREAIEVKTVEVSEPTPTVPPAQQEVAKTGVKEANHAITNNTQPNTTGVIPAQANIGGGVRET